MTHRILVLAALCAFSLQAASKDDIKAMKAELAKVQAQLNAANKEKADLAAAAAAATHNAAQAADAAKAATAANLAIAAKLEATAQAAARAHDSAALAASLKDAQTAKQLAKQREVLARSEAMQRAAAERLAAQTDDVRQAQNDNAGAAQQTAEEAKEAAATASANAAAAALASKLRSEEIMAAVHHSDLVVWSSMVATIVGLVGMIAKVVIDNYAHAQTLQKVEEVKATAAVSNTLVRAVWDPATREKFIASRQAEEASAAPDAEHKTS
jgi:hypothetical protein